MKSKVCLCLSVDFYVRGKNAQTETGTKEAAGSQSSV